MLKKIAIFILLIISCSVIFAQVDKTASKFEIKKLNYKVGIKSHKTGLDIISYDLGDKFSAYTYSIFEHENKLAKEQGVSNQYRSNIKSIAHTAIMTNFHNNNKSRFVIKYSDLFYKKNSFISDTTKYLLLK